MDALTQQPTSTDEEAIRQVFRDFEAAFRKSDIDGMPAVIYERAAFAWDQTEVIGQDALRAAFMENMVSVWKGAEMVHTVRGVEFLSPDAAVVWGNYVVTLPDGSTQHGHLMNTFMKRAGKWLFASEQTCAAHEDQF